MATRWAESSSRTRTAWSTPHHAQVVSERSRVVSTPQSHSTKAISGHHLKILPNPTSWTSYRPSVYSIAAIAYHPLSLLGVPPHGGGPVTFAPASYKESFVRNRSGTRDPAPPCCLLLS